jgi:alkylation response protein AidB-like acyl-CoA dehydrogenase
MDFELTEEQRAIAESVTRLLRQHAGPKRARVLVAAAGYDHELAAALQNAGFVGVMSGHDDTSRGAGALSAALVLETIARHAGLVAYGASALVAPLVLRERLAGDGADAELAGPVALATADTRGPVRFGAHARTLLLLDGDIVRVRRLSPGDARPVPSNFGFPMAYVATSGGDTLGGGAAERMRASWRVALAAEIAGTMRVALDMTVEHVKQRSQFGRPLGAFQALQHRLAECAVLVEASYWLALESAWLGATAEHADLAFEYAASAAKRVFHEAHQMHGAMGLTREHDLCLWSMRLPALSIEGASLNAARP